MIALLSAALALACAAPQPSWSGSLEPQANQAPGSTEAFQWKAPSVYVEGEPFVAELFYRGPGGEPLAIPTWHLRSAGFSVNGKPLGTRDLKESLVSLDAGSSLKLTLDLGPSLAGNEGIGKRDFSLAHAGLAEREQSVAYLRSAAQGLDFMTMPVDQLDSYQVVLVTNRGTMRAEFWPEVAPNHVRNFLDLCYSGFYDGSQFHRVIPGFMIQGGQSATKAKAPRTLKAEFSDRRHVPGVLSAARLGHDINSASSEFFIMHAVYPSLDGKYSPFGKLVEGIEVVNLIVDSGDKRYRPTDPRHSRPPVSQIIERAIVIRAPRAAAGSK